MYPVPTSTELSKLKEKPDRRPRCVKCRIHNKISIFKGHASTCPFRNCPCKECKELTAKYAKRNLRRKQEQLELKANRSNIAPKSENRDNEDTTINSDVSQTNLREQSIYYTNYWRSITINQFVPLIMPPSPAFPFPTLRLIPTAHFHYYNYYLPMVPMIPPRYQTHNRTFVP